MNKKKVLVIDDEQIVIDSVEKILGAEAFVVDTTLKGPEGIQRVKNGDYDIVLTDVRMPDISGKIVLREIKRFNPALPVVIISGYATVSSAIQCMRLGASNVLEKPFTPEELLQAVNGALETEQQGYIEEQGLIHEDAILKILERAERNPQFAKEILEKDETSLDGYHLTTTERLALLTGDVEWFEQYLGVLEPKHRHFLESMS